MGGLSGSDWSSGLQVQGMQLSMNSERLLGTAMQRKIEKRAMLVGVWPPVGWPSSSKCESSVVPRRARETLRLLLLLVVVVAGVPEGGKGRRRETSKEQTAAKAE
jgi:hypothetical protein